MKPMNSLSMKWFLIILICFTTRFNLCSSYNLRSSLQKIIFLDGFLSFDQNEFAAQDFGDQIHLLPLAVLHPRSVRDVAKMVEFVWQMGPDSPVTVAARGNAHSTHGQAQADQHGIVINVEDLSGGQEGGMEVHLGEFPYVDVSGGELWINVLQKCLNYGLAPKSWTDYLYLTVGGTLSNAGISGQAFRHGPQISNVLQLEVVTGKGVVVNCSEQQNPDLFHAVLGGLGQFGIITRARISLEPAPKMVKWIKAMYSNFSTFSRDQEHLISSDQTFDYIEGFVIKNKTGGSPNSRKLSLKPDGRRQFKSDSEDSTFFSIELTKNFNPDQNDTTNQEVKSLLSQLNYIPSTLEISEVSYETFLNRVHESEIALRSKGLWEVPHPWLNLIIPKSKIQTFAQEVFGNIVQDTSNGIIIVYPVNKSKWSNRTSFVFPEADEEVFYLASLLFFANPNSKIPSDGLEYLLAQNKRILDFCEKSRLGVKQYLPYHTTTEEWKAHFGPRWQMFVQRKKVYDPLAMLAPGQRIFQKSVPFF